MIQPYLRVCVLACALLLNILASVSAAQNHTQGLKNSEFLTRQDFFSFVKGIKKEIHEKDSNEDKQAIKLSMIQKVEKTLKNIQIDKQEFKFELKENLFDIEIWDVFKGNLLKALQLYVDSTIGKRHENLFLLSGAGDSEKIAGLKKFKGGYVFITDRTYTNSMAYNTRNKIYLVFYRLEPDTYICVNQHISDEGEILNKNGVTKKDKPYGPIYYDLGIDIYKKISTEKFQFISFNVYDGQMNKTRFKSINAMKTIGNIFTLGTLDKGISSIVEKNIREIWDRRRDHFQRLISEK